MRSSSPPSARTRSRAAARLAGYRSGHDPADSPWTDEVLVSFDGQVGTPIQPEERLEVRRSARPVNLIRLGPETFFKRLRRKLHWGDLSDRVRK